MLRATTDACQLRHPPPVNRLEHEMALSRFGGKMPKGASIRDLPLSERESAYGEEGICDMRIESRQWVRLAREAKPE